jgi:hypothetical protein
VRPAVAALTLAALVLTGCARHAGGASGSAVNIAPVPPASTAAAATAPVATTAPPTPGNTAPDLSGIESDLAGASAANAQAGSDISAGDAATGTNDNP